MDDKLNLEIDQGKVARYFYRGYVLSTIIVGVLTFGIGLVATLIYAFTFGPWLSRKQAAVLDYRLEGTTIRIDQGVYFLKRKAIPLDRVTDIVVTQGPLMRSCNLWRLDIQTAGSGQQQAEGYLFGLCDPEGVRDKLLSVRDSTVKPSEQGHL